MSNNNWPNFFVMGAQKSATTSLHYYLINHPDIYLPKQKETKFFVNPEIYSKGFEYYIDNFFSGVGDEKAIGEIDPDYMYFENGIQNMANELDLKNIKFIFIFRNPVDRAYSHYMMTYRRGFEDLSFEEAISCEERRIKKDWRSNMHYSYISRGKYLRQLERISCYVSKENMLFLLTDELQDNPEAVVEKMCKFLSIPVIFDESALKNEFHKGASLKSLGFLKAILKESYLKKFFRLLVPSKAVREKLLVKLIKINESSAKVMPLKEDTRKELMALYHDDNIKLANFIGKDLSVWLE